VASTSVHPAGSLPQPGEAHTEQQPIHLDPDLTLPAFLRRISGQYRDRTALIFNDERWSYRRLVDEVTRMEAALLGLGATKGTRIAVVMGARPEWVVAVFAAMSIGAVAVPISTFEPPKKRDELLRHADASIVIVQDQLLRHRYLDDLLTAHPRLDEPGTDLLFDEGLPYLRHVIHLGEGSRGRVLSWDDALSTAPALPAGYLDSLHGEVHPTDDALIIYTSGTSGVPKGVIHAHRSAAIQFDRLHVEFTTTQDDVVWGTYPLFWSAGTAWVLGGTLGIGATLVMQEWFDPAEAVRLIEKYRVTVIHITPNQIAELEEILEQQPADISSLRIFPRGSLTDYVSAPPDHPFGGASLGLTETMTLAASVPWDAPVELRRETHGKPLPGTVMKIIAPETGETLPTGELGEIAIKGTTLMKAYNKAFPETYLDAAGYYRTKDAGYFDDEGWLHWTGRMTEVIRTNAANVSPAEVEAALYENPAVKVAAVVGVPDESLGELVVACVVPKADASLTGDDVRAQLKGRLATYKIPARVFVLEESELELTATGKVVLSNVRSVVAARMGSAPAASEQLPPRLSSRTN
jgi:acyl-CoA synthetase (AMP-forming)/AMP-acid ligase II